MPKVDLYTISGKKSEKIELPKEIFGVKPNKAAMAQAVRVYLANQRTARPKTKTRGEITGSGRKIWRQKGTGRARHGDQYAPIFVGGGVSHGPTGQQNYNLKINKNVKRIALFSALTTKLQNHQLSVIQTLSKIEPKTKRIQDLLSKIISKETPKDSKSPKSKTKPKISLIICEPQENITRAARNIDGLRLIKAESLNSYYVLNGGHLIITQDALDKIQSLFRKAHKA